MGRATARLAAWKASSGGVKGPAMKPDGTFAWPAGRTLPREVRELAGELLVSLGMPAAVECLVDPSASHMERRAWTALLKDMSVGDAVSLPRDQTGEDVPGVAWLPAMNERPVRPPELDDVEDAPAVAASSVATDAAGDLANMLKERREAIPRQNGNGRKNGNGNGKHG